MKGKFSRLVIQNFVITTLIIFCFALDVAAQEEAEDFLRNEIDYSIRYAPSRSVDDMAGKVTTLESDAEYSYELKVLGKLPVKLSLGNYYMYLKDSTRVKLPSRLVGWTSDIETTLPFFKFKETYIRLGISPSFYADDWSFDSDAFRLPLRSFLIYRPNKKWTFLGGVALYPNYKNRSAFFPILGLIYKPIDQLTFNIIPERPNITYALNEHVTILAEGDISLKEFDIDRSNTKDVVLRYKEWHVGGGTEIKFNKLFRLSATAGGIFDRTLKYSDKTAKVSIKDGFYTELRATLSF